jgi:hypothetical protein
VIILLVISVIIQIKQPRKKYIIRRLGFFSVIWESGFKHLRFFFVFLLLKLPNYTPKEYSEQLLVQIHAPNKM